MPVRIPKARSSELFTFGVAGVAGLAPLYMIMPGASERIASQTARWAPRWERNINYFTAPVEWTTRRISPGVERTVKRLDEKLPLERAALATDRGIKRSINRVGAAGVRWPHMR